ncbi:5-oxoprolinase subunit PxpB [Sporosarcina sp. FSL K6-3457]|uniref:5-oxoprolinase subunit PxpB n=1 Tax=Sporosarcina sp. FSL K6-3457 TaxID=2978204 RepID=UPI0030FB0D26
MKLNHRFMPSAMVISEQSIRFDFKASSHQDIRQFCSFIESYHGSFLEEVVPSMNTVTVFYRKKIVDSCKLLEELRVKWLEETDCEVMVKTRFIDVPVCYDERFSEDLPRVMTHTGLTRGEVIALHTGTSYTVYMIGFLPGFPYLGDLPTSLHVPRLAQPRLRVPKGTVGIGGTQTGIYPIESPGGWNIIGRTPLDLYSLQRADPFLIHAGDQLFFRAISMDVYHEMKEELKKDSTRIQQFVKE